jgi:predicted hotdog family 3-hydroxylacyl-ACP dehydratase
MLPLKNILALIPQRAPFVMIDELLCSDENSTQTRFRVKEGNVLVTNGEFSEGGLLENIAQTAAAGAGYMTIKEKKPVSAGYIGAVKNLEIFDLPKINDELVTEVRIESRVFDVTVISGTVRHSDTLIAQCEMNIYIRK